MAAKGYIYVLTNKTFSGHNWVKIGYAADVERRRRQLSTTALPYPYEIYATYEIPASSSMADKVLHRLITQLNPSLRLASNREFFEMTPEEAYSLLEALATIHNCEEKLTKFKSGKPIVSSSGKELESVDQDSDSKQSGQIPEDSSLPLLKDFHEEFHIDTEGGRATLRVDSGSFVVKAGSIIRIRDGKEHPMTKTHESDLSSGLLVRNGDYATLTADKAFASASLAGEYVVARSANGWTTWKGPNGKPMDALVQRK